MRSSQTDLFAAPLLPGLSYAEDIVTPAEEQALIASIDAIDLTPFHFQGWLGKRVTASFGWNYDFDRGEYARAAPIPDFLLPLRERAAAFAGLDAEILEQALLTRYDPGAGIGWHRDRPVFERVIGVSLGVACTLRFRKRIAGGFAHASVPLAPRSVYDMAGEARYGWEHSIAKMEVTRRSVTFRSPAAKGSGKAFFFEKKKQKTFDRSRQE